MSVPSLKAAARSASRGADFRAHVVLSNLPRTALPADIRRLCESITLQENVSQVALDYEFFKPSGRAFITFRTPLYADHFLKAFRKEAFHLGALQVQARSVIAHDEISLNHRTRGSKGRSEAGLRGALRGHGPSAGLTGGSRNILLSGLPVFVEKSQIQRLLNDFDVAVSSENESEILQTETQAKALTSSWVVRMTSDAEAHRLVRKLHETDWPYDAHQQRKLRVKAHILQ